MEIILFHREYLCKHVPLPPFLSGNAQPPLVSGLQCGWQPAPPTSTLPPSFPKEKATQRTFIKDITYVFTWHSRFCLYDIQERAKLNCGDRNQKLWWLRGGRGLSWLEGARENFCVDNVPICFGKWLHKNMSWSKHSKRTLKVCTFYYI